MKHVTRKQIARELATMKKYKKIFPSIKAAEAAFDLFCEAVARHLSRGNEVQLADLGTFKIVERAERKARNPQTGEPITVKAHKVVKFKPCPTLKSKVAKLR